MTRFDSFEAEDGSQVVVGAGDLDTVRDILRERAALLDQPTPRVTEDDLVRWWGRRLQLADEAIFEPCQPWDDRAEVITVWRGPLATIQPDDGGLNLDREAN